MYVEAKGEAIADGLLMITEKNFRCTKGHEWKGPFAGLIVNGTRSYGPICPDCYGKFLERLFGTVQEVTEPTGADAAGTVPAASNR